MSRILSSSDVESVKMGTSMTWAIAVGVVVVCCIGPTKGTIPILRSWSLIRKAKTKGAKRDSKSATERRVGSIPTLGTTFSSFVGGLTPPDCGATPPDQSESSILSVTA